jgi:hypothetical protein
MCCLPRAYPNVRHWLVTLKLASRIYVVTVADLFVPQSSTRSHVEYSPHFETREQVNEHRVEAISYEQHRRLSLGWWNYGSLWDPVRDVLWLARGIAKPG